VRRTETEQSGWRSLLAEQWPPRFGLSLVSLLVANLFTIVVAIAQHWNLAVLMWIYWGQSVIIGGFNFFKILSLQDFSTEGFKINNRSVEPTEKTKRQTAFFFLIHYGLFHVLYFGFLVGTRDIGGNLAFVAICILVFLVNHLFSFLYNAKRDRRRRPNIGTVMFFPYARILPLHLTIIFGSFLVNDTGSLIFFLLLKTLADLIMHGIEHGQRPVASPQRDMA
jgi:hypothetical protein